MSAYELPQIDAFTFLDALFNPVVEGYVHLFALNHTTGQRQVIWRSVSDLSGLSSQARLCAAVCDVWFGPATRVTDLGTGRRGGIGDCAGVCSLWVDIDVAGPNHAAPGLPPTMEDAYRLLRDFPIPPSVVVESGGGLQPWWFLSEFVARSAAIDLLNRWGATWTQLAQHRGWHLDNVFDISRVMRLPATFNHKVPGEAQPVGIVQWSPAHRYTADDVDQHLIDPPVNPTDAQRRVSYVGGERPGDAYNASADLAALVERLGAVYDHESGGDLHYRAPHHQRPGETGITIYADGHVTVYSATFAAQHGLQVMRPYDAFGLFTYAFHAGDWIAATRDLADHDWGSAATGPPQPPWDDLVVEVGPFDFIDLGPVFRGEKVRPLITMFQREDGVGLLPAGINAIFGDSGDGKSMVALVACVTELRQGHHVMWTSYEDADEQEIAERLMAFGVTEQQAEMVHFNTPDVALKQGINFLAEQIERHEIKLWVLDSIGEAMGAEGLDPNADADVGPWFRDALRVAITRFPGLAVLGVDHTNKSRENRLFAGGSQRKRAALTGRGFLLEVGEAMFGRGVAGSAALVVAKDRSGWFVRGSTAATVMIDARVIPYAFTISCPETAAEKVARPNADGRVLEALRNSQVPLDVSEIMRLTPGIPVLAAGSVRNALTRLVHDGKVRRPSGTKAIYEFITVVHKAPW